MTVQTTAQAGPELSIVLPVYDEGVGISRVRDTLLELMNQNASTAIEIIFVDDHSADDSPEQLQKLCREDSRFRYLRLSRNSGSHIAILAGLAHARGACSVFLASDLQDPPELIAEMLTLWRAGNHVVWAVRSRREGISGMELAFARAFYWLLNRFGQVNVPRQGSDFALLDRVVVDALLASVGANPSLGAAIAWLGFQQAYLPYTKRARQFGRSKWNLAKQLKAFADVFVGYSFAPMRLMSYLGISTATIGFLYAAVIVALRLRGNQPIEGWSSIMVVTLVLGGIQLTTLGVLGEYLWRALGEARKAPLYVVEAREGFGVSVPSSPRASRPPPVRA